MVNWWKTLLNVFHKHLFPICINCFSVLYLWPMENEDILTFRTFNCKIRRTSLTFYENIIINIISLTVLRVNKIELFWNAYQMTRHIMVDEFSWFYFNKKWIIKLFILQIILIKVVQQAKRPSCSWLYLFI